MRSLDGLEPWYTFRLFTRVAVRMELQSKLAVLLFNVFECSIRREFEIGIIVAFEVGLHHVGGEVVVEDAAESVDLFMKTVVLQGRFLFETKESVILCVSPRLRLRESEGVYHLRIGSKPLLVISVTEARNAVNKVVEVRKQRWLCATRLQTGVVV